MFSETLVKPYDSSKTFIFVKEKAYLAAKCIFLLRRRLIQHQNALRDAVVALQQHQNAFRDAGVALRQHQNTFREALEARIRPHPAVNHARFPGIRPAPPRQAARAPGKGEAGERRHSPEGRIEEEPKGVCHYFMVIFSPS